MTRVLVPRPDIEADVSAEQVTAYLLRPGSGWIEAVNLSAHWRTFTTGLCTANVPRSALVNHRVAESIHDIARAEQRHPSAVLADIVGPAAGVAGRGCVRRVGDWFDPCFCRFLPACERHGAAHGAEESEGA